MYPQSSETYANLLQAAYAAEVEVEKGRAAQSKAANLTNSPDKVDIRSRDPSPIVASVAAIESKLDKCLKAVSKAAQAPSNKTESSKQGGNIANLIRPQRLQQNIGGQFQQQALSRGRMGSLSIAGAVEVGAYH